MAAVQVVHLNVTHPLCGVTDVCSQLNDVLANMYRGGHTRLHPTAHTPRLLFTGCEGRSRHEGLASFLAEVMRMQLADKDPAALQERRMVEFLILSKQLQQLPEEEEVWKVSQ
jgi:hypothetical protein